jgi:ribonuclease P protein component
MRLWTTEDSENPAHTEGEVPTARAGFVVSKAIGNAVVRNKVKRRLRHLIAEHLAELPAGADVVVRALPAASTRTFTDLEGDLVGAIQAAKRPRRSSR